MTVRRADELPSLFFWLGEYADNELERPAGLFFISDIQRKVADAYDVPLRIMVSANRHREFARPRQIAMYLSKRFTRSSLPQIGKRFGGRDHTTVIHAVRTVERMRASDPDFDKQVRSIAKQLEAA